MTACSESVAHEHTVQYSVITDDLGSAANSTVAASTITGTTVTCTMRCDIIMYDMIR
jgi:hypothetical protein